MESDRPSTPPAASGFEQQLREMNEALLKSSVRQHELAEQAQKAEAALRSSEIRYRRLFQAARDGILILDAVTGRIMDANAIMSGLVGMELGELVGKRLHEIGMFKNAEEYNAAFRELQRNQYLRHDHLSVRSRSGGTVQVEIVANVYQEDHRLVAQCNVRDISERVEMERRIHQQTAALAEQSRLKDEFLAMLSHELRNPLAPIRAAVHLLKIQQLDTESPTHKQTREIIERQVLNLTKLVDDLLEVSRVVSGRIQLKPQTVDTNQVIKHALETTKPLIEKHRHTLKLDLCNDPAWVSADPTRLEEVIVNLLNNAAKYTPDGGRIEVCCERESMGDQNAVLVRVRDNGMGIDKELLPRIFDLFTQADRSLARSQGGLGIGLCLAHRLMQLHGGTIEAHSQGPGMGSEFTLKLPLVPEPAVAAPDSQPPSSVATGRRQGAAVRVLVVDDNVDLVRMLSSILRAKGYSVESAYTGTEGLKVAQEWRPHIALLDIGLPGLDGYEVARRLRTPRVPEREQRTGPIGIQATEGTRPPMRLIALTGYGRDTDVALAREAGFDGHMVKPFDFDELETLMAQWGSPQPTLGPTSTGE